MYLGINQSDHTVYEGISTTQGRGVWPQPFISQAQLFERFPECGGVPQDAFVDKFKILFREDFFDPVTRIRRGRFYKISDKSIPHEWTSQPHPTLENVNLSPQDGRFHCNLVTFEAFRFKQQDSYRYVSLGDRDFYTVWKILSVERVQTGEFLATIKSTSNADILPDLDNTKFETEDFKKVNGFLQKVVDAVYKAGTESIIDRCRDTTAALLTWSSYRPDSYTPGDDLDTLLKKITNQSYNKNAVIHCSHIIRILHSRTKPSVQEKHQVRSLNDGDATLALLSLASIIRDLGLSRS